MELARKPEGVKEAPVAATVLLVQGVKRCSLTSLELHQVVPHGQPEPAPTPLAVATRRLVDFHLPPEITDHLLPPCCVLSEYHSVRSVREGRFLRRVTSEFVVVCWPRFPLQLNPQSVFHCGRRCSCPTVPEPVAQVAWRQLCHTRGLLPSGGCKPRETSSSLVQ